MSNEACFLVRETDSTILYEHIYNVAEVAALLHTLVAGKTGQMALVTIELRFDQEGRDSRRQFLQQGKIEQSIDSVLDALRRLVRKTDIVCVLHTTCYFLLLDANLEGAHIVCNRLWDALLWRIHNTTDGDILRPRSMSIGYAAYPQPYQDAHDCVQASHEAKQLFEIQSERRRPGIRQLRQSKTMTDYTPTTTLPASPSGTLMEVDADTHSAESELSALARKLGVPYLSLLPRKQRTQIQQLVALELAHELHFYPLGRERGILTVAVANPQDVSVLDRLHQETGLHIFPVLTPPHELQMALDQLL